MTDEDGIRFKDGFKDGWRSIGFSQVRYTGRGIRMECLRPPSRCASVDRGCARTCQSIYVLCHEHSLIDKCRYV
ncbi:unnamed protein product [Dracunculus medinensis]|uniref:Uncharacterized protein n=1 Tax=Dracunculus medinensis TaxID=318479 RepID=A0A0N4UPX3_DRAME|nr:unnamed protein product [Dracunculus medinensis]